MDSNGALWDLYSILGITYSDSQSYKMTPCYVSFLASVVQNVIIYNGWMAGYLKGENDKAAQTSQYNV